MTESTDALSDGPLPDISLEKLRNGFVAMINTIEVQQEVIDQQASRLDLLENLVERLLTRVADLELLNVPAEASGE